MQCPQQHRDPAATPMGLSQTHQLYKVIWVLFLDGRPLGQGPWPSQDSANFQQPFINHYFNQISQSWFLCCKAEARPESETYVCLGSGGTGGNKLPPWKYHLWRTEYHPLIISINKQDPSSHSTPFSGTINNRQIPDLLNFICRIAQKPKVLRPGRKLLSPSPQQPFMCPWGSPCHLAA